MQTTVFLAFLQDEGENGLSSGIVLDRDKCFNNSTCLFLMSLLCLMVNFRAALPSPSIPRFLAKFLASGDLYRGADVGSNFSVAVLVGIFFSPLCSQYS